MVPIDEGRTRLHIIEEVGMIANFFKLHQNIKQLNFVLGLALTVNHVDVATQDTLVELLLYLTHSNV